MKKVRIAELRGGLSRYLGHVRKGGTVIVLDRDVPIAKIVPLAKEERAVAARQTAARKSAKRHAAKATSKAGASEDEARTRRQAEDEARLDRLERAGVIRRGKGGLPDWFDQPLSPKGKLNGSVLEALLEERESGW